MQRMNPPYLWCIRKSHYHFRISHSPNGWTDGELARNWIERNFDPQTREKAAGRTRILLLDGHKSHYTQDVLQFAHDNNIRILGYPPHCTHALQGLDVVCFARMKEIWKEEINSFETVHQRSISKGDFTGVFGKAYIRAFLPTTIKAAFEATGVHPFNANIISEEQMKPSLPTSIKGSFPLPQPSPVRRVMAVFRDGNRPADPDSGIDGEPPSQPTSPVQQQNRHITMDLTPRKRVQLLSASLKESQSSYLISDPHITSSTKILSPVIEHPPPLPEPNWSLLHLPEPSLSYQSKANLKEQVSYLQASLYHAQQQIKARNMIIESNHAQMIIQDMYLHKQNLALQEKENRKKDDRTILFPNGHGRCLTEDAFREAIFQQNERAKQAVASKKARVELRAEKRALKEAIEERWKSVMVEWQKQKNENEVLRQQLILQKTRQKDLPKPPPRPKRAEIKELVMKERGFGEEMVEDCDDDEEEMD